MKFFCLLHLIMMPTKCTISFVMVKFIWNPRFLLAEIYTVQESEHVQASLKNPVMTD